MRDAANNVTEGYSQSFTTLAVDAWGTKWTDTMTGKTDGTLTGQTFTEASQSWQTLNTAVTIASGKAVRTSTANTTAGTLNPNSAIINLTDAPTNRVRMTVTGKGGDAGRAPFFVLGANGAKHNRLRYRNSGATQIWQWDGNTVTEITGATTGPLSVDGWNEHTWVLEVDVVTREVTLHQDSTLKLAWTIPAGEWVGGLGYGFDVISLRAVDGYATEFSVQWD